MATQPIADVAADPVANDDIADTPIADVSVQDQMYPDDVAEDPENPEGGDLPTDGAGDPNADVNDALPAIEPPVSWSPEDKEQFKALTALGPEGVKAAEVIARRETERDNYVAQKGREAAQTRQLVESEARGAIVQTHEAFAQQLEQYAQLLLPEIPDARLLYTGNPQDAMLYTRLQAEYQAAVSQHQQMQSQAEQARSQASQIKEYERNLALQGVAAEIAEKLGTEWTEPSARQKLQEALYPIGKELGYSDEAMRDANASDILALKAAHSWKAKADKWDALQKAKMEPVRAAKQPLRVTQPGAAGGNQGSAPSVQSVLYPNDPPRR